MNKEKYLFETEYRRTSARYEVQSLRRHLYLVIIIETDAIALKHQRNTNEIEAKKATCLFSALWFTPYVHMQSLLFSKHNDGMFPEIIYTY